LVGSAQESEFRRQAAAATQAGGWTRRGTQSARGRELRPLGDIIELVSLVHDGEANGRGGNTYVIVRYKPGADVKPPEWHIRENMSGPAAASPPGRDRTPAPRPADAAATGAASLPPLRLRVRALKPPGGTSPIPTSWPARHHAEGLGSRRR
jgi:hypothetical protein